MGASSRTVVLATERPGDHLNARIAALSAALAAAVTVAALLAVPRLPSLLSSLPVAMTLTATCAFGVAALVGGRARSRDSDRLRWAATGFAVTGVAMWVQLVGFPAISPNGGPFGTTGDGAASLYLLWHLLLPLFLIAGVSPIAASRTARRGLVAVSALAIVWVAAGSLPGPVWFSPELTYLPVTVVALWADAALSAVAIAMWVRSTGRGPMLTEAVVTAGMVLTTWDVVLHGIGPERFTAWWWASLALRVAGTVVPAIWLSFGAVRLFGRLEEYADALEVQTEHERTAKEQLAALNAELEDTNEELDSFAGVIAHDLRAPIATTAALLDVVLRNGVLDAQSRDLIERARRRQDNHAELVEEVLRLARARGAELSPSPVDPAELLRELASDEEVAAALTIEETVPVTADPAALGQMLGNLVGNAVRYVPEDRLADVRVRAIPGEDGWVRIEVADNGPGVPVADRDRIFHAFDRGTTNGGRSGTGLGLAIVRRLAERHGGRAGVECPDEGGSVFWFTVPATDADVAPQPSLAPARESHEPQPVTQG